MSRSLLSHTGALETGLSRLTAPAPVPKSQLSSSPGRPSPRGLVSGATTTPERAPEAVASCFRSHSGSIFCAEQALDREAIMRFWYWIVRLFRRRAAETDIHNREELRKWNLDEAARQEQRWIAGKGGGR